MLCVGRSEREVEVIEKVRFVLYMIGLSTFYAFFLKSIYRFLIDWILTHVLIWLAWLKSWEMID